MIILFHLLVALAVNGIVIYGVGWKEWNGATALAIYWIETIVGGLLVAARIWLHRSWTRKAGHFRSQLGLTVGGEGGSNAKTIESFFAEFLTLIIVFSLGHAVFLVAFLFCILKEGPDPQLLRYGALAVVLVQFAGFLVDLGTLRAMPFVTLKRMAGAGAARVLLIQFAIIGGMGLAALSGRNEHFLIPFAVLKLLADVLSAFASQPQRKGAPGCLVGTISFFWPKSDFEQQIAAAAATQAIKDAADEEVMPEKKEKKR